VKSVRNKVKNLVKEQKKPVRKTNRFTPQDRKKFFKLYTAWSEANGFWSRVDQMMQDETYDKLRHAFPDEILARLILDHMQKEPTWIMSILPELTGHDIEVPEESMGKIQDITDIWLKWARKNNYLEQL